MLCVCNAMHCGALLAGRFPRVVLYHLLDLLPHTRAETDTEQRMYSVMHGRAPNFIVSAVETVEMKVVR